MSKELIKKRIKNQLRIHWGWLRNNPHEEVADFINNIVEKHYGDGLDQEITDPKSEKITDTFLREITAFVREKYGSGKALKFYVDVVQEFRKHLKK